MKEHITMLKTMKKLKILFTVCILLAGQQLFSSTLTANEDYFIIEKTEQNALFEEMVSSFHGEGEVQPVLMLKPPYPKDSGNLPFYLNSEDFKNRYDHFAAKSNQFGTGTFDFKTNCFSIIFVPLYIQTGNFIL